jgi:hypothetical protein
MPVPQALEQLRQEWRQSLRANAVRGCPAHAQQQLAHAFEAQVADAQLLLRRFQEPLEAIEAANDLGAKARVRPTARLGEAK